MFKKTVGSLLGASALVLTSMNIAPVAFADTPNDPEPTSSSSSATSTPSSSSTATPSAPSTTAPSATSSSDPSAPSSSDPNANSTGSSSASSSASASASSTPSIEPGPTAGSPLDFSKYEQDPEDYLLPAAAKQFKNTQGEYRIGAPLAGGKAVGAVPAGLESYYAQKVNWGSCEPFGYQQEDGTECGYAIVPLDYKNPTGQTIAIGMFKHKAEDQANKKGTIFSDPGGPGASGMDVGAYAQYYFSEELRKNFDIVGFDPRGVGSSLPQIRCQSSAAMEAQRHGSDGLSGADLDKILKYNTDQCYENTGKIFNIPGTSFIPQVGTENVVNDLDILRSVVGDEKLSYVGFSYGTSIGYHYAMQFPANIRALVLDGQVNPFENNHELLKNKFGKYMPTLNPESPDVAQMRGFGQTFVQYIKNCLKQKNCPLGPQVTGEPTQEQIDAAYAEYHKIVRKAWQTGYYHVSGSDRAVSFNDVYMGTIQAMYSQRLWTQLTNGLRQMKNDRNAYSLMYLADSYYNASRDLKYDFSDAAFRTISCTDSWEDSSNRAVTKQNLLDTFKVAPFADPGKNPDGTQRGAEEAYGWCYYYRDRNKLPIGQEVNNAPNILVISSSYDPATPFENGVVAADALNGTLLAVAHDGHCAYGTTDCATTITDEYMLDPDKFTADVNAGKFNKGEEYTGLTPVTTKDLFSKVIQGNTCQVHRFFADLSLTTDRQIVKRSGELILTANGFTPGEEVFFEMHSKVYKLGSAPADENGRVTVKTKVPSDLSFGNHTVVAFQKNGKRAEVSVSLVPPAPPKTGITQTGALAPIFIGTMLVAAAALKRRYR